MHIKVRAPGRVNLIGEHTDYNKGFVLPIAINMRLQLEMSASDETLVKISSENFGEHAEFIPSSIKPISRKPHWSDYIKGVYWVMKKEGYLPVSADFKINSNIPAGSGLSSSAALEVAVALALFKAGNYDIPMNKLAAMCQRAENEYVGVRCGIMDQFAVSLAKENNALLIDCQSNSYSHIPFKLDELQIIIVDTRVERSLASSAYNKRRTECEQAVEIFSTILDRDVNSLRDVNLHDLKMYGKRLPETLYKRSRFVVEENIRVEESVKALSKADLESFGYFMKRSHAGLRDLYEVSCDELDHIVAIASSIEEVLGARMTGAGFGGCAIVLAQKGASNKIKQIINQSYSKTFNREPAFYDTTAADGASIVEITT